MTPLPNPARTIDGRNMYLDLYTADQMHAYAAEQVAAERERCVNSCRSAVYGRVGSATMRQVADWCAEEIASGREPFPGT